LPLNKLLLRLRKWAPLRRTLLALHRARYRRALSLVRVALVPLDLQARVERALVALPLAPADLVRRSSNDLPIPDVIALAQRYEELNSSPAWGDFMGRVLSLQQSLAEDIVIGTYDKWGRDMTPAQRMAMRVLEEIIAIPGNAQIRRREAEHQALMMESLRVDDLTSVS
jgi:hypothetical protein